ncbi:MAG: hypothetical protein ACRBN8_00940 [Nannocystales bacterium]
MPAIARVDLAIDDYTLTTTAGSSAGTSSALTQGAEYLVVASGNAQNGNANDVTRSNVLVGGTVFGRASSSVIYNPTGALSGLQNGGTTQVGAVFAHTPGTGEQLEVQSWSDAAGQGGQFRVVALDLSGLGADDWQSAESPNSDVISDQPLATDGWIALDDLGGTLTFTPASTGDWLIFASVEAVPQTGATAADEIAIRTSVDGVSLSGTETGGDVNGVPLEEIYGYLTHDVVSLTGGVAHTIQIEANGVAGGGNIGFRRVRVHALRVGAFVAGGIIQTTDAGEVLTGTTSADLVPTTLSMSTAGDYLLLTRAQKSVTFWSEANILVNGAPALIDGYGVGGDELGTNATDDLLYEQGLHIAPGLQDTDTVGMRISKVGGGGSNNYGADIVRPGGGDLSLIALRLETLMLTGFEGTSSSSANDLATLAALRGLSAMSAATTGDTAILTTGSTAHYSVSLTDLSAANDFGRLTMDPILQNVLTGPIEAHYPGTSESLPWYCNAGDSAVTLVERVKRPAVTNGTTVVLSEGAPDMNSVATVSVEYFSDANTWVPLAGTGDVVITGELDESGAPFWDLRFQPDPAAFAGIAVGERIRRRWTVTITGGTSMNIPQKGHGFMVVNEDPEVTPSS